MNAGFTTLDYAIFIVYAIVIVGLGLWLSRTKKRRKRLERIIFLGGTLHGGNWSLTYCSQHLGRTLLECRARIQDRNGIAAYEWIAALTLILLLSSCYHK
jgi:SSS family solute:Na+ symporter